MNRRVRFKPEERLPDVLRIAKRKGGAIRPMDLASELGLSNSGASSILIKLADRGLLIQHGEGRFHSYTVPTEPVVMVNEPVKKGREPAQPTRLKANGVTVADMHKAISFLDDEDEVVLMGAMEQMRIDAIQVQVSIPPRLVLIVSFREE